VSTLQAWLNQILTCTRFYNAHETSAVEEFAIALLCGDVRCDVREQFTVNHETSN
jgi:hypothetical protein